MINKMLLSMSFIKKHYPKDRNVHRPPHMYVDGAMYFVTTRTLDKKRVFDTNEKKESFMAVLSRSIMKFHIIIYGWVILSNHYHLLFSVGKGKDLSKFINNLHTNSSRLANRHDITPGRRIWHQYRDHTIRDEADFFTHLNYIHHNPVKHGLARRMEDYSFSSYRHYLKTKGTEWLDSCFEIYPVIDFTK